MAAPRSPRAFLSYSHDSDEHADRILALAYALCDRGIDVILDRFVHPAPAEGWPLWMERNLKAADFVLLVCTETYCRRVRAEETPGQGTGVRWEGRIVYNHLCYGADPGGTRFIPILLPGAEPAHIPDPVRGHNYYRITAFDLTDPGFEALYRHLTDQPATPQPDLGSLIVLPPRPRPRPSPGPLPPSGGSMVHVGGPVVGAAIGTGNTVTARDITAFINSEDQADPEVKRVLIAARRALESGPLAGADKADAADDLRKLAEEVTQSAPQPGRVRRLFESLKQLAPDVAAILSAAAKIDALIKG